ncbi:MAG: 50S ribosomal protein L17 [bacterium]
MRHRKSTKKLQRKPSAGLALRRSLVLGLIEHGAITTTLPKAKVLRPFAEKLLTLSRKGSLSSHRLVIARLGNKPSGAKRLREHWAPKFKGVPGGYLRIKKLGPRRTDGAEMARIEFVTFSGTKEKVGPEKK